MVNESVFQQMPQSPAIEVYRIHSTVLVKCRNWPIKESTRSTKVKMCMLASIDAVTAVLIAKMQIFPASKQYNYGLDVLAWLLVNRIAYLDDSILGLPN